MGKGGWTEDAEGRARTREKGWLDGRGGGQTTNRLVSPGALAASHPCPLHPHPPPFILSVAQPRPPLPLTLTVRPWISQLSRCVGVSPGLW